MIIYRSTALCLFVLLFASAHGQKSPKLYMANFTKEDRIAMYKNKDTSISWVDALNNLVEFPFKNKGRLYIDRFRFLWLRADRKAICIDILKKKAGLDLRKREFLMDEGYGAAKVVSDTAFCIEIEDWESIGNGLIKVHDVEAPEHKHDVRQWRKGSIWDIELEGGREPYLMDLRFEGDQTEEFEAFCQYIFKLAHFEGFKE